MIAKAASEARELGREGYVRRAFQVQYNLILLGGVVLFALASASPALLLAGLAFEILWLGVAPSLPPVQRWLDERSRHSEARPIEPETRTQLPAPFPVPPLEPAYAHRLTALEKTIGEIRKLASGLEAPQVRYAGVALDEVTRSFAKLCETHQRLAKYIDGNTEPALIAEVERLKSSFTAEKDLGLRLAIRQSIGLAQRRVEQRTQVATTLRTTTVRLEALERGVIALLSQARTLGSNQALLAELDLLRHEIATNAPDEDTIPRPFAAV